jgi:hypothetical protein
MFGRKRQLLREGAQARALVIAAKQIGQSAVGDGAPTGYSHVTLRVQFDDDTTTEITRWVSYAKLGRRLAEGSFVPVRYDPADRTRIVIDSGASKRAHKAAVTQMKQRAVARGEQELAEDARRRASTPPTFAEIKAQGRAAREGDSGDPS